MNLVPDNLIETLHFLVVDFVNISWKIHMSWSPRFVSMERIRVHNFPQLCVTLCRVDVSHEKVKYNPGYLHECET